MSQGRIAVLIVSLLVLAGLGLLVIDTTRSPTHTAAAPLSPAEVLPAVEQVTTIPAAAPAVTTTGAPTSIRQAPGPTPSASIADTGVVPGRTSRPRQGTYRYRYAGSSPTVDATLTVTAGPGASRQTHSLVAGVASQKTLLDWTGDARTTLSSGADGAAACTWEPGLLSLRLPLVSGLTWKADATCRTASAGSATSIHRTEEAAIEGATRTKVDGRPVDVWVLSRHTLTEVTTAQKGKAVIEAQSSELFAPSLGLVVYQVTRTATPQPDGTTATTTQITELLQREPVSGAT